MAKSVRPGLPSFWVTGLAKILVGEQPCLLEQWTKGRFKFDVKPPSQHITDWKVRHTALLTAERERLEADGWKCSIEKYVRVTGLSAIVAGKTDLIAQKDGCRPKIVDCKGGEPKDSDVAQVKIYQVLVPMAWKAPSMLFDGEVVYGNVERTFISAHDAVAIKEPLFKLLRQLGTMMEPTGIPTESNCRYCDLVDCAVRITTETPEVQTVEF